MASLEFSDICIYIYIRYQTCNGNSTRYHTRYPAKSDKMPKANDGRRNDLLKRQSQSQSSFVERPNKAHSWGTKNETTTMVAKMLLPWSSVSWWVPAFEFFIESTQWTPLVILLDLHICAYTYAYVYIYIYTLYNLPHQLQDPQYHFNALHKSPVYCKKRSICPFFPTIHSLKLAKSLFPLWGKWSPQRVRRKVKELELPHHLELGAATLGAPHL